MRQMELPSGQKTSSSEALFFSNLPVSFWRHLFAFELVCWKNEVVELAHPSCCREFIFTEPEALISPSHSARNRLFIIFKDEKFNDTNFRKNLLRLELKLETRVDLTRELFQQCLVFTMLHRIAPLWNRVGDLLVQGKTFFEERRKLNAVRFSCTVFDEKICISLRACLVKLPFCEIRDFGITEDTLQKFSADSNAFVTNRRIENANCLVLPSLSRASIVSISRKIPDGSPFDSYEEMRRHWKRMHGIHLPSKECLTYYNVCMFYEKVLTYPSVCIRSHSPLVFNRCDDDFILQSFLTDLVTRLPSICGTATRFSKTALFPEKALRGANINADFLCRKQALKGTSMKMKETPGFEKRRSEDDSMKMRIKETLELNKRCNENGSMKMKIVETSELKNKFNSTVEAGVERNVDKKQKLVPTFTKRAVAIQSKTPDVQNKVMKLQTRKLGPTANTAKRKAGNSLETFSRQMNNMVENKHNKTAPLSLEKVPSCTFKPERSSLDLSEHYIERQLSLSKSRNQLASHRKLNGNSIDTPTTLNGASSEKFHQAPKLHGNQSALPKAIDGSINENSCATNKSRDATSSTDEMARQTDAVSLAKEIILRAALSQSDSPTKIDDKYKSESIDNTKSGIGFMQNELFSSPADDNDFKEPVLKKPRSKAIVQEKLNVIELARKNELNKANAATLRFWLSQTGIKAKSNTKKDELIKKVHEALTVMKQS